MALTRPVLRLAQRAALVAAAVVLIAASPGAARAGEIRVYAASSLMTALDALGNLWTQETGHVLRPAFAGSSALARQIEQGAPADIFISANNSWMDRLDAAGLLAPGTRRDLLGNRLVLVAPAPAKGSVNITPDLDLAALLDGGRLAMALVEAVPAGIYGKAALESLGLWQDVAPHVAQANNVRAALALVARGEAPAGIVYASDVLADSRVAVLGVFPAGSHPPIVYPAAALRDSDNPLNATFLEFLRSDAARTVFHRHGFTVAE